MIQQPHALTDSQYRRVVSQYKRQVVIVLQISNNEVKTRMEVDRKKDSNISTHVLDTAKGLPVPNLRIELFRCTNALNCGPNFDYSWVSLGQQSTDNDGRSRFAFDIEPDIYKMVFYTQPFYESQATPNFYPKVEVIFRLTDVYRHHHIPLLLSPYGYSTYRGS